MPVRVVTDSVAAIPPAEAAALGLGVVTLFVTDGERSEADLDIDHDEFYQRLEDIKHLPKSSQPSIESLVDAFRRPVAEGLDVLGVFISEKMSGTVPTARLAADMVRSEFPDARIEVVDSRSNSMQEGFAAMAAARAAIAGESLEACRDIALDTMRRTRYLFTPASLEYLRRGGRIGNAGALLGQILQIRPILTVENGETTTFSKVRTQGRALAEIAKRFAEDVAEHGLRDVVVHYIGDRGPAEHFATDLIEPIAGHPVRIVPVSPVVGLHVGPAVALAYECERPLRP